MTMQRSAFGDVLAPGFRQIFMNEFGLNPTGIEDIFNVTSSSRQYEDDSYIAGFGLVPKKTEGAAVTYDDPIQGYDKRYTHDTYSMAYRVTKEMWEDELYGIMKKLPAALGRSMNVTLATDAANMLNNGFDVTYAGGDGLEMFSELHPLVGGGTQRNELDVAADLSDTSWETALIDIADTTDDRGLLLHLVPKKIIVPSELAWYTHQFFGSAKEPDSGNNAINPANTGFDWGGRPQVVVNRYLTDADAWFIQCENHKAYWFWRVKPDHYQGNDFDTDDAKFKVRARWSRGWSMPWGWYASPGA